MPVADRSRQEWAAAWVGREVMPYARPAGSTSLEQRQRDREAKIPGSGSENSVTGGQLSQGSSQTYSWPADQWVVAPEG